MAVDSIAEKIFFVRGERVMLDIDLAAMYEVKTGNLNLAVRRNMKRFPVDFMFQLTEEEAQRLRLQIAISKKRGGRRYKPYAFTEQGVAMLSGILRGFGLGDVAAVLLSRFVPAQDLPSFFRPLNPRQPQMPR